MAAAWQAESLKKQKGAMDVIAPVAVMAFTVAFRWMQDGPRAAGKLSGPPAPASAGSLS